MKVNTGHGLGRPKLGLYLAGLKKFPQVTQAGGRAQSKKRPLAVRQIAWMVFDIQQ